ncbi:MAG: hypothetical protein JWO15_1763 [Sphingomonadales bacterium]|nr:hypothetical protein [Sphingomonadales bacterium]
MEFAKQRRQQSECIHIQSGNTHKTGDVANVSSRTVGESLNRCFDDLCMLQQSTAFNGK